ncbi:cytochrome P450 2D3-like [Gigantopelta aegis]|uniref:cytochrome P450 2D3-like n=1 Tax=Gigantopelta aegis TaxID=1735272 RepID=UPI001B88C1BE|nr:cytochrome P450 2D3-like [Gigantopelta aegis]
MITSVSKARYDWNPSRNQDDDFVLVSSFKWIIQQTVGWPMIAIFLIVMTAIIGSLVRDVYRTRWLRLPPGPLSLPFIGGLYLLSRKKPHIALESLVIKYGKIFTIQMGVEGPLIFVNEVEVAKKLLKTSKMADRPMMPIFKHLSADGKDCIGCIPYGLQWKKQQRLCHAALMDVQNLSLEDHVSYTMDILFKWFDKQGGKPFDPAEVCEQSLVLFQHSCIYGLRYESMKDLDFIHQVKTFAKSIKCLVPDHPLNLFPWLWYLPSEASKNFRSFVKERNDFLEEQVQNQKSGKCFPNNVLNHMLKTEQDSVDTMEIKVCAWTMNIGGSTTLSSTLKWLLLYLAHHRTLQKRLQQELDSVTEQGSSMKNTHDTPFTDAVIKETMRISPPNPFGIPHTTNDDIHVENFVIPKGTNVMINIWQIHHDKNVWKNPRSFQPQRFLSEDGKTTNKQTMKNFMPFSGGARPCIGRRTARTFMHMFTISLFKHFNVSLEQTDFEDIDIEGSMTFGLDPAPYKIRITRRESSNIE